MHVFVVQLETMMTKPSIRAAPELLDAISLHIHVSRQNVGCNRSWSYGHIGLELSGIGTAACGYELNEEFEIVLADKPGARHVGNITPVFFFL